MRSTATHRSILSAGRIFHRPNNFAICFLISSFAYRFLAACQWWLTFRFFFKYPLILTCVVPVDDGGGDADDCDAVVVATGTETSKLLAAAATVVLVADTDASCDAVDWCGGTLLLFFTTNFCMMSFHRFSLFDEFFIFHFLFHSKSNNFPLDFERVRHSKQSIDGIYIDGLMFIDAYRQSHSNALGIYFPKIEPRWNTCIFRFHSISLHRYWILFMHKRHSQL